jgi:hypothetical protein
MGLMGRGILVSLYKGSEKCSRVVHIWLMRIFLEKQECEMSQKTMAPEDSHILMDCSTNLALTSLTLEIKRPFGDNMIKKCLGSIE